MSQVWVKTNRGDILRLGDAQKACKADEGLTYEVIGTNDGRGWKLHIQQTHDFTPIAEKSKAMQSEEMWNLGESRLVANIPLKMWAEWAKKHGVRADDHGAMREVVHKELMNPDNAHFRVWNGNLGRFKAK